MSRKRNKNETLIAEESPAGAVPSVNGRIFLYQKLALFFIAFLVYVNSIPNQFNMDDEFYTTASNVMANKGLEGIGEIFTSHTFHDNNNDYEYRPVTMLTFAVQHRFFGSSPQLSHFINVVLFAITCVMLFSLLCRWFGAARSWLAFFCCLLFAVHPLHTEVVNSIKSRDELLSLLLGAWSLYLIWNWVDTKKIKWILISQFVFLLALLSKNTITPFALVFPIAIYFFTDMPLKQVFYFFLLTFVTYTVFWLLSNIALPPTVRSFYEHENPLYADDVGLLTRYATVLYVIGWYLYLHVVPHPLVFFYGYKYVPLVTFADPGVWISVLVHAALLAAIIRGLKKKSLFSFGGVFYFLNIFVFSNLLIPAPGMMAERFVYAASLGFCIMVCSALYYLFRLNGSGFSIKVRGGKYLAAILLVMCVAYSIKTISRNPDWMDRGTLYSHDIPYLEGSAKANMLYGEYMQLQVDAYRQKAAAAQTVEMRTYYIDSARYYHAIAKKSLLAALAVSPDYESVINNIAVVYFQEDSLEQAKYYLVKARSIAPGNADISYNIGAIYSKEGKADSAIVEFAKVIDSDPSYMSAYRAISDIWLSVKDTNAAVNVLLSAAQRNPDKAAPYGELANIALFRRDTAAAVAYCEKAAELQPPPLPVISFLANYYGSKGNSEKANYYSRKLNNVQAATAGQE